MNSINFFSDRKAARIERSFDMSDISLNTDIWKMLSNNSKDGERIKRKELRDQDKIECKKIIDYARTLIANEFNRKTTFQRITKNMNGYAVRLVCSKNRKCNTRWPIRFIIPDNRVNVTCNELCDHFLTDKPSS